MSSIHKKHQQFRKMERMCEDAAYVLQLHIGVEQQAKTNIGKLNRCFFAANDELLVLLWVIFVVIDILLKFYGQKQKLIRFFLF